MYAHIRGEVSELYADRAVLEAAGVGYELFCSGRTLHTLTKGKGAKLLAHLHVHEGALTLYGFQDEAEKAMFRKLLTVTRVGPKLALAVLSTLSPSDVAAAIFTDNAEALSAVPGLGKKTAQRVLLELKEKISAHEMGSVGLPGPGAAAGEERDMRVEAVAALVGLGYDGASAQRAVLSIESAANIEELITRALRALAK